MKNEYYERAAKLTHNKISVNSEKQQHSTFSFKSNHKRKKGVTMFKITISSQYTYSFPAFRRK